MEYDHYKAPKFSLQEAFTPQGDNRKNKEWNTIIIKLQSFLYRRRSRPSLVPVLFLNKYLSYTMHPYISTARVPVLTCSTVRPVVRTHSSVPRRGCDLSVPGTLYQEREDMMCVFHSIFCRLSPSTSCMVLYDSIESNKPRAGA